MNIFDLRVRPPYKSFLTMGLYRNLQKNIQFSQKLGTTYAQAAKEQSMDLFFKEMDDAGVSQCGIPGRKSKADCVDNDDIAELVTLDPHRGLASPAIEPLDNDPTEEIVRSVIRGTRTGIIVEPGLNIVPMYADDTHIFPIYEMCEDNGIPVIITCGSTAGLDVSYSMPTHIEQVAVAFPNLTIIVTHGCWPWTSAICHVAFRRANLYLSPDIYFINTPGSQDYTTAALPMCRDKLIYGTSYPAASMKEAVSYYTQQIGTHSQESLAHVMYENASRLFPELSKH